MVVLKNKAQGRQSQAKCRKVLASAFVETACQQNVNVINSFKIQSEILKKIH